MAGAGFIQQGIGMYTNFSSMAIDAADTAGQQYAESETQTYNAEVLEGRALQTGAEGARNEEQFRRGYRDFAGKQLTSIAEGGLSSGGSALDVVRDSETRANLDALKVRYEATTRAEGLMSDARQARFKSALALELAKKSEAKRDGILNLYKKLHNPAGPVGNAFKKNPLDSRSSALNPR